MCHQTSGVSPFVLRTQPAWASVWLCRERMRDNKKVTISGRNKGYLLGHTVSRLRRRPPGRRRLPIVTDTAVFLQHSWCPSALGTRRTPKLPNSEASTCPIIRISYHTVLPATTVPWLRWLSPRTSSLDDRNIHKVTVESVSYITLILTLLCIDLYIESEFGTDN